MQIKLIELKRIAKLLPKILLKLHDTVHSLNTKSNILFNIKQSTLELNDWKKSYPGNSWSNREHIWETSLIISARVSSWMLEWLSWFLISCIRFTSSPTPTSPSFGISGHPRVGNTVWWQQFLEDIKVLLLLPLFFFIIQYYLISNSYRLILAQWLYKTIDKKTFWRKRQR